MLETGGGIWRAANGEGDMSLEKQRGVANGRMLDWRGDGGLDADAAVLSEVNEGRS